MSAFTALNIEVDDHNGDDEVDNTKEIQIEEAFRLYQIAINLHKQGADSHVHAKNAYQTLFKSEIFGFPESITEFDRNDGHLDLDFDPDASLLQGSDLPLPSDDIPNTLPQILYLAYKNYGLLILDMLKHELKRSEPSAAELAYSKENVIQQARIALDCFGKALASDESDTDLWRCTARVAKFLGSKRTSRYALEAAAETDDDPALGEVLPPSLGEGFASEQLKELLQVLSDEVSLEHSSLEPYKTKSMSARMKKYMDPYSFLPETAKPDLRLQSLLDNIQPAQMEIVVTERSWQAVGMVLCRLRLQDSSASRCLIRVPPEPLHGESPASDHSMNDAPTSPARKSLTPIELPTQSVESAEPPRVDAAESVAQPAQVVSLPSRKRSHSTLAGVDTPEEEVGTAKRSKRLRNREAGGDGGKPDPVAEELNSLTSGDTHLFLVAHGILERLGVEDLGTLQDLKDAMVPKSSDTAQDALRNTALRDFRAILASWDDNKAGVTLGGNVDEIFGSARGGGLNAGMATFLEHTKSSPRNTQPIQPFRLADGLSEFIDTVEQNWMVLQSIIILWLESVYKSYCEYLWSDEMKVTVVRLSTYADAEIYEHLCSECERLGSPGADLSDLRKVQDMIQMLFELHLDIYTRITGPGSIVDIPLRVQEKDRLARWLTLAGDIQNAVDKTHLPLELELRYHWARAFYAKITEGVAREHMISLWADQRAILTYANDITIELQNNAVMPEISAAAAEREISRLTSMDLFVNLFSADQSDPCAVIQILEPVLDPACVQEAISNGEDVEQSIEASQVAASEKLPRALRDIWKFLEGGSTNLRLILWTRLREAYQGINYTTKVFSCHLKSIEVIVGDIQSQTYIDTLPDARYRLLLMWIHALDDLLVKALTIALNDATAFEIIDDAHIKSTGSALAHLSRILHCAAIFDDESRLGFVQMPRTGIHGAQGSFTAFFNKLKEMQVRTWALQYTVIKDGISQNREKFPAMDSELAEYMAAVHYALGLRKWCKASNKIFLKMMKLEMVRLKNVEYWEDYLGQVLFDLYGVKLGAGVYEIRDHGCPTEPLDKRTTHHIMPLVITLANRLSTKDLLKSELRTTIERMQQAIGMTKPTIRMMHNLRNYTEYLKSPVTPLKLYQALKGQVYVDSLSVTTPDTQIAEQGWFFLLGNIALAKFNPQKRSGPGALEDLKIAATFFRLQIQFTPEHWETWYRLAQCFDADLDEEVLWTAEKMNDARPDLARQQRSAILSYIMAVSTATRYADATFETASKLSDLYKDFGMRIYSSSREPFNMEAFYLDDFEKHFSGDAGMYKKVAMDELTRYKAWRYAAMLFKRALLEKPDDWTLHYMYGKCLWKMYHKFPAAPPDVAPDAAPDAALIAARALRATRPSKSLVISALKKAVSTAPKPSDRRQDPILEPHYKILSIVHKLVLCGDVEYQAGVDILQDRPYSLRKGERVEVSNSDEWEEYVLESLRQLRNADKANWHHRMISRHAQILHETSKQDVVSAAAAQKILGQTMFTKTMQVSVWKPDCERPGRHFVYMERYVRYMIKLLFLLNDKTQLDLLAKRIRKRPGDYFRFTDVWTECCTALYKLIRRHGDIPMDRDEDFKSVSRDEYGPVSDRLTAWVGDTNNSHPVLDSLREIIDLKKLNGGCMKTAPLDDLINDVWAVLYFDVGVKLSLSAAQPNRPSGPMSLGNMMNLDGAGEGSVPGATGIGQDPSRPSKLGISRREILRSAETAVTRVPEAVRTVPSSSRKTMDPSMILPSNAPTPPHGAGTRMAISVPSSTQVSTPGADKDVEMRDADATAGAANGGDAGGRDQSSEPGSVHDSADDESDLSDVPNMDDEDAAVIFPDLARPPAPAQPANPRPQGDELKHIVYVRPPTVRGMEKLHPVGTSPGFIQPQWQHLPAPDFTMARDGVTRINLNDTVWIHVVEGAIYPNYNIQKLARILDIRTARTVPGGHPVDLCIVAWYWSKNELIQNPEPRISRLGRRWPADPARGPPDFGRRSRSINVIGHFEYMLSNHRDVMLGSAIQAKADERVKDRVVPDLVLFCDGMEPEIEHLSNLMKSEGKRGWLERAELSAEGVVEGS